MKTFDEIWKEAEKIPGLVTKGEMRLLWDLIQQEKDNIKVAVEIGPLYGRSTSVIVQALPPEAIFYTIEPFVVNGSDTRPYFKEQVLPKYPNLNLLEMPSHRAAMEYPGPLPIDFIFIDGDHQDHSILEDCHDWLPVIREGGLAAFHDYNNNLFPAVATRVEEATRYWQFIGEADSLVVKRNLQ